MTARAAAPDLELAACTPRPLHPKGFNRRATLPFGLTTDHIAQAMNDYLGFIGFVNTQLHSRGTPRMESMFMPANFSSMVGEYMVAAIPKYSPGLVKNAYHNGHPDLIPAKRFPRDSIQHCNEGIEVKGSRYLKNWQGHNPEDCWLMVFVFDSNRPVDSAQGVAPKPFQFITVLGAQLTKADWLFAGRSETSRRTITASVTATGYGKMLANWIYREPDLIDSFVSLEE
jgi:hypothetical protein